MKKNKSFFVETFIYLKKEGLGNNSKMKVLRKFESCEFHYYRFAKL